MARLFEQNPGNDVFQFVPKQKKGCPQKRHAQYEFHYLPNPSKRGKRGNHGESNLRKRWLRVSPQLRRSFASPPLVNSVVQSSCQGSGGFGRGLLLGYLVLFPPPRSSSRLNGKYDAQRIWRNYSKGTVLSLQNRE